jgi:hypothetical protein
MESELSRMPAHFQMIYSANVALLCLRACCPRGPMAGIAFFERGWLVQPHLNFREHCAVDVVFLPKMWLSMHINCNFEECGQFCALDFALAPCFATCSLRADLAVSCRHGQDAGVS